MRPCLIFLVGFCAAGLATCAEAQFRADYESSNPSGVPMLSRLELSGASVRLDAGRESLLFATADDKVTALFHHRHKYLDLHKSRTQAHSGAALANLAPEQRMAVEQRSHDEHAAATAAAVAYNLSATGTHDRVHAIDCETYRLLINGRHGKDLCLADIDALEFSAADKATLQRAFAQLKPLWDRSRPSTFRPPLPPIPAGKFPLRITRYNDDDVAAEVVELKQLDHAAADAADFAVPKGYREDAPGGSGAAR